MFGRYRNLIVLVGVLFAQILGLAVQVKRTRNSEPTRLIRIWTVGTVSPLEKGLSWIQSSTGNIWGNYLYLRGVRAENRELKRQIEQMRLEQARMTQDADQAHRLQALLGFKEQFISRTVAAQVIGGSGSDLSRVIYIDKGYADGIKTDMAVLTKDGIVGKVLRVDHRHVAQVLLIDDQTSGVGAILEKSRLQGILRGTSSGGVVLEKVMSDETVPIGERVLTSGGDGIFPKGLSVGTVTKVTPGNDLFLNVRVHPDADLSRIEEVLVVTQIDEKQVETDQTTPIRAVDILAQRLPTVPPKPETTSPGQTPGATKPAGQNNAQSPAPQNSVASARAAGGDAAVGTGATHASAAPKPKATTPEHANTAQASAGAAKSVTPNSTAAQSGGSNSQPTVSKPKASVPAASGSANTSAPAAAQTGTKTSAAGTATASGTAKKAAPKPANPDVKTSPKPPAQDAPH